MRQPVRPGALALACVLVLSGPALVRADQILPVDGGWSVFMWSSGPNVMNQEGAFTFTSAVPTRLTVTDSFIDGDRFLVYDKGLPLFLTSAPADDGAWVADPDTALHDPRWSSGSVVLAPGAHAITVQTVQVATGYADGGAFLRVDSGDAVSQVPEPASLALAVLGAAGLAAARLRRGRRDARAAAS
jgi:hypothetical protein